MITLLFDIETAPASYYCVSGTHVWLHSIKSFYIPHWPLTRYVKSRFTHALGMPGMYSLPPTLKETASWRFRHASRHVRHARAVMHVGIANPLWRGKRSRHSRRMRDTIFSVFGKRPMQYTPWNRQSLVVPWFLWLYHELQVDSCNLFAHILQGSFTGTNQSKAQTVCTILGTCYRLAWGKELWKPHHFSRACIENVLYGSGIYFIGLFEPMECKYYRFIGIIFLLKCERIKFI